METEILKFGFGVCILCILLPELRTLIKASIKLTYNVTMYSVSFLVLVAKNGVRASSPSNVTSELVELQELHKLNYKSPKDKTDLSEKAFQSPRVVSIRRPSHKLQNPEEKRRPVQIEHEHL